MRHMEVGQQVARETAYAQIGLSLHVVSRQLCWDCLDFPDNGFVRHDVGPESSR
jgi:hypothetical protein